jgi:hypothetical protein
MSIQKEYADTYNLYKKKTSLRYIISEQYNLVNYKYKFILIGSVLSFILLIYSSFREIGFIKSWSIYLMEIEFIRSSTTYLMEIEFIKTWSIFILYLIPIILLILFKNESRKMYRKEYKIDDEEIFDLYFHPFYKNFLNTKKHKQLIYIESLLEYAHIISEKKTNNFLYNPIAAFSISAIIAIIVNIITSEFETFLLIKILIFAIVTILYYYMIFSTLNANNHISFKEFLIKLKFYVNNNQ